MVKRYQHTQIGYAIIIALTTVMLFFACLAAVYGLYWVAEDMIVSMPRNTFYPVTALSLQASLLQDPLLYVLLLIIVPIAAVVGCIILKRTLAYSVEDRTLIISYYRGRKRRVPLNSIKSVRLCHGDRVLKYRLAGASIPGLDFGYYKGDYGIVMSYVKSSENVLLIELHSGKKIAISNIDEIARKIESMGIAITRESHVAG